MCVQKEGKKAKKNRLVYRFIAIYFFICMYAVCARIHVPIFISIVNDRIRLE